MLLVDEIAKLRTGVADDLCEVLGLDINSCIRSECCTLSDAGSRLGLTCCTAMESSLMLAERSASGRPAEPLDRIPPGSVQAQTLRLLDAMRLSAGGDSGVNWQQTGAWRDVVRPDADFMAIALVMMGGVVWRSAELLAIELQQSMHGSVQKMLDRVERKLVVDSNGKDLGFTSLWSKENAVVRDHVLAATFLAEDVSESSLVVDVEDSDELPVKNKDKADPSDLDKMKLTRMEVLARRDKAATEVWKQFKNPALDGLTWGNAVFLGLPFAWTCVEIHSGHDPSGSSPRAARQCRVFTFRSMECPPGPHPLSHCVGRGREGQPGQQTPSNREVRLVWMGAVFSPLGAPDILRAGFAARGVAVHYRRGIIRAPASVPLLPGTEPAAAQGVGGRHCGELWCGVPGWSW